MTVGAMATMQRAYYNIYTNQTNALKSLRNLSSGLKINTAADDAAGLAVSEGMRGQIGGMGKAYENTMQGIAMIQTAEGDLSTTSDILVRMEELAVQSSNGTYTDADRTFIAKEFDALKGEMDRISSSSNYNGINLLDGSLGGTKGQAGVKSLGVAGFIVGGTKAANGTAKFSISKGEDGVSITATVGEHSVTNLIDDLTAASTTFTMADGTEISMNFSSTAASLKEGTISGVAVRSGSAVTNTSKAITSTDSSQMRIQVGANGTADQQISFKVGDMSSVGIGLQDADISTLEGANAALKTIREAVSAVNTQRSSLGATQNRLESTSRSLSNSLLNLYDSESAIRDADMAQEMMNYTQYNILQQASQAMLSQSMNLSQQNMLSLIMR